MAGVLVAANSYSLNVPYKVVAWTGNVYLPPTVHYTAFSTTLKKIPPVIIRKDDYGLARGATKVVSPGKSGLKTDTYESWYINSRVITTKHVASHITKPVARIISVGKYVPPPPPPPAPVPQPTPEQPVPISGSGYVGGNSPPAPPASSGPVYSGGDPRAIARGMVSPDQWSCLDLLWSHESGWNTYAENASSGAYGIPQALPGSKMASAGADWQTNPATQIRWGLAYIAGVYGTPCGAWAHELAVNWY